MDRNGVKVTYIETQFVTSDAAGFKSLVQSLTGNSPAAAAPARQLHRPRPRHADGWSAATAGPSGYRMSATAGPVTAAANDARTANAGATGASSYLIPATAGPVSVAAIENDARAAAAAAYAGAGQPSGLDELHGLCDYTELFSVDDASERHRDGSYSGFPY